MADERKEIAIPRPPDLTLTGDPDTFRIRGWKIFRPGFFTHGQQFDLNTAADCAQIIQNFHALYPDWLVPKLRIGHSAAQPILKRLVTSAGVPNAGRIVDMYDSDGWVTLDLDGVPREILLLDKDDHPFKFDFVGAFRRGNFDSGSAEFVPNAVDPRNPGKKLPGLTLEAVALLGEEHPAVAGGGPIRATYARDFLPGISSPLLGGPTVARVCYSLRGAAMPTDYVDKMTDAIKPETAAYAKKYSRFYADGMDQGMSGDEADQYASMGCSGENKTGDMKEYRKRYSRYFSKKKMFSAAGLKYAMGYDDPEMRDVADGHPAPVAVGGNSPAGAADGLPVEWPQAARDYVRKLSDRVNQVEGAVQTMTPKVEEAAQYSSRFENENKAAREARVRDAVERAVVETRLSPFDKANFIELGLGKSHTKKYAADAANGYGGMTELEAFLWEVNNRPKLGYSQQFIAAPTAKRPGGEPDQNPLGDRANADRILAKTQRGREIIAVRSQTAKA